MFDHIRSRKRGSKQLNNSAFTLIELLVVVAIVITLAAILYPVIIQSKDAARMGACSSNLRQLAFALKEYSTDYNGYSVPLSPSELATRKFTWTLYTKPLIPYTGQRAVGTAKKVNGQAKQPRRLWICPGDVDLGKVGASYWSVNGSSYMYPGPNGFFGVGDLDAPIDGGKSEYQSALGPRRPEEWWRPSRDVLLCDYSQSFHKGASTLPKDANGLPPVEVAKMTRSMNILMVDGHVTKGSARDIGIAGSSTQNYISYVLRYDNRFSRHFHPVNTPSR